MKRALILGSLAALLTTGLAGVAPAQASTVRADAKCTKVNERVQVRGTTYRCVKSGTRSIWQVQATTVRVGRGCTKEGELATVGAAKTLFSCYEARSTRALTWKQAGKECIGAVKDYADSQTTYRNLLAQLAEIKAEAAKLDAAGQAELAKTITDLETTVKSAKTILGTVQGITRSVCSL